MGILGSRGPYNDGVYHFCKGEYDRAVRSYRKAVERNQMDHKAWNNLGLAEYKMGNEKEALVCFNRALSIRPEDTYAMLNKAGLTVAQGRYAEALMMIERAILMDPRDPYAYNIKGTALMKSQRYGEAVKAFEEAVGIDPHFRHAKSNLKRAVREFSRSRKLPGGGRKELADRSDQDILEDFMLTRHEDEERLPPGQKGGSPGALSDGISAPDLEEFEEFEDEEDWDEWEDLEGLSWEE